MKDVGIRMLSQLLQGPSAELVRTLMLKPAHSLAGVDAYCKYFMSCLRLRICDLGSAAGSVAYLSPLG